VLSSTR